MSAERTCHLCGRPSAKKTVCGSCKEAAEVFGEAAVAEAARWWKKAPRGLRGSHSKRRVKTISVHAFEDGETPFEAALRATVDVLRADDHRGTDGPPVASEARDGTSGGVFQGGPRRFERTARWIDWTSPAERGWDEPADPLAAARRKVRREIARVRAALESEPERSESQAHREARFAALHEQLATLGALAQQLVRARQASEDDPNLGSYARGEISWTELQRRLGPAWSPRAAGAVEQDAPPSAQEPALRECANPDCQKPTRVLRKNLCTSCYKFQRRTGRLPDADVVRARRWSRDAPIARDLL